MTTRVCPPGRAGPLPALLAQMEAAATVQDFETHGAAASTTKIDGQAATLLLGANLLTYGPTVVKAAGVRTIAVTMRPGWDKVEQLLPALGGLALRKTTLH